MPIKFNMYPSRQKPDIFRTIYLPVNYYNPRKYASVSRYMYVRTLRTKRDVHPNKFIPQSQERTGAKPYHETIYVRGVRRSSSDRYHMVNEQTENRLDIISQLYYGTPTFWWAIAQANASTLFNVFDIPRGTKLRIPEMTSLYADGGYLSGRGK